MPIPRRYTTDAIVLSRFDLGEADRVLTVITPTGGKLKVIAKGIRRPTSRLGGSLEPFAELTVALARGRTFDVVTQVSVGHAWLNLRDSLESTATAWYLAELADRSLEERHAAEPLYALLRRAYELLDAAMAPGRVARWYEMHLLDELGQRPEVDRCVECDRVLEADERFRWVPPLGGVLCQRCPGPPHERAGISLDAVKLLKAYQRLDIEALAALRLAPDVERETEAALREFVRVALERDARSLAFLDEVRSGLRGQARAHVTGWRTAAAVGLAGAAATAAAAAAVRIGGPAMVGRTEARLCATASAPPYHASDRARSLHERLWVADLHADSLLWGRDLLKRGTGVRSTSRASSRATSRCRSWPPPRNRRAISTSSATTTEPTTSSFWRIAQGWPPATWRRLLPRALHLAARADAMAARLRWPADDPAHDRRPRGVRSAPPGRPGDHGRPPCHRGRPRA